MTIDDVKAMIGKTYTLSGNTRTVCRIDNLYQGACILNGNVYWKRPGGRERRIPQYLPYFLEWVEKAREVPDSEDTDIKLLREMVEHFDDSAFYFLDKETKDAVRTLLARVT